MSESKRRVGRSEGALSRETITHAAIALLDASGEAGLTVRALTARLRTGSGAVYWHVANKKDLLADAAAILVEEALGDSDGLDDPLIVIRRRASRLFDVLDAHPWLGAQLSNEPLRPATLAIFESFGAQVRRYGASAEVRFHGASALLNFVLGLAGQYAAAARLDARSRDRSRFLASVAESWQRLDPSEHPFLRETAEQLREHDDRAQFLAGIDLILAGVEASFADRLRG